MSSDTNSTVEESANQNGRVKGFSFSAISTFKSCPKAFQFKYIKKLPEAFSSIEARMGGSVHEVLEWAYIQRQEGHEPTLEQALEQYSRTWNNLDFEAIKIVKEDKTREDYYKQGREYIIDFFNRLFPNDRSTTLYLEQKFQIPIGEEVIYRGVIDRIAKGPDGTIRVTDYKTGKVGHPLDTLQLPSYALYIFQHNIDQEIELCYEDLREKRTVVVRYNRKEVKKISDAIQQEIEIIRNTPQEEMAAKPSILCLWCGYNPICDNPHPSVNPGRNQPPAAASTGKNGDFEGACPLCDGQLRERKGKFGTFLGCVNYPECRYTRDPGTSTANPVQDPNVEGKDICPECGSLLKQRKGKYGDFMGCTSYPECRFTRPVE